MEKRINDFITNSSETVLTFDRMTGKERLHIHEYCEKVGLFSTSEGNGKIKRVIIYKEKPLLTEEENKVTDDDRKQFIKDFGLPFPVYKEPYFSYFLETLDPVLNTKQKYVLLTDAIEKLDFQGKKLKTFTIELSNKIIQQISEQTAYEEFTQNTTKYITKELPPNIDIYGYGNETFPKVLFSFDIIKANFSSMKFHNSEIVFNCTTWEELIQKYTDIKYFTQAKFFRQIIFNRLSSKGIPLVQKHLLSQLYNSIKSHTHIKVLGRAGNDELFVISSQEKYVEDLAIVNKIINELPDNIKTIWRITPFSLAPLGKSDAFIKTNLNDNSIEIIHFPKDFYVQAYKYYMKLPLDAYDMKAMKDDFMITYDEPYVFD